MYEWLIPLLVLAAVVYISRRRKKSPPPARKSRLGPLLKFEAKKDG